MGRTPCCNEDGLKKGAWTSGEDHKLIAYIQQHGEGGWRTLPQKAGLKRCGKSCRLRWTNYLRPDIKRGELSAEEEQKIIELHASLGNRWSAIARHLPKRTDNEIKNYWNTHIKKRLMEMTIDPVTHMQINPSPTDNSTNHVIQENINDESEIGQTQRPISASAKLLNKVAAKFALLHRKDITSPSLDAIKAVLVNSTKDTIAYTSGTHGGQSSSDDNDSDVEIIISSEEKYNSEKSKFTSRSITSQMLNKMATKLALSKNFDLVKDGVVSSVSNSTKENVNSNNNTSVSYEIEPSVSISDFIESIETTSSSWMEEDEALGCLDNGIVLEDCPMNSDYGYVGNFGAEDRREDWQPGFNNLCEDGDFIGRFTSLPFGGSPNNDYTDRNYYCGDAGKTYGQASEVTLNYWNQDFDSFNYAMQ